MPPEAILLLEDDVFNRTTTQKVQVGLDFDLLGGITAGPGKQFSGVAGA